MSSLHNESILLGLSFLEATAKKDEEMNALLLEKFSKDEIIRGLVMVSMAMTTLGASARNSDFFTMIETARKAIIVKSDT